MSIATDQKVEMLLQRLELLERRVESLEGDLAQLRQEVFDPTAKPRQEQRNGNRR